MFTQLSEPRKKKRIHCEEASPFPVPIASITNKPASNERWFYYNALLKAGSVYVTQEGDIHFLYKMGFFGKGNLSRGKPQHSRFISSFQGLKRKNLPPQERRFQQQRFQTVRKQRYERHLAWYKHLVKRKQMQTNNANQTAGNADDKNDADDERIEEEKNEQKTHRVQEGSSSSSSSSSLSSSDDDGDEISDDVKIKRICLSDSRHQLPTITSVDQDFDSCKNSANSLDETHEETSMDEIRTRKVGTRKDANPSKKIDQSDVDSFKCNTNSLDEMDEGTSVDEKVEKRKFEIDQSASCSLELTDSQTVLSSSSCLQVTGEESAESIKLHPGNHALSHVTGKTKKKLKRDTNKEDPYKISEYLQLSLEEAFFLSYGLGCLVVRNENKELMNLTDMWKEYCSRQPTFLRNYIAYHYYRSRGWVPKTGVKFGAEFILYKKGPPFYHASYSVIVRMADERSLGSTNDAKERWSRWAGLNRVTETVAKEVLFCYVIKPTSLTDQELMSPKCISSFTIQEIVMKRIVPSRERANPQLPPEIT